MLGKLKSCAEVSYSDRAWFRLRHIDLREPLMSDLYELPMLVSNISQVCTVLIGFL